MRTFCCPFNQYECQIMSERKEWMELIIHLTSDHGLSKVQAVDLIERRQLKIDQRHEDKRAGDRRTGNRRKIETAAEKGQGAA